MELSAHIGNCKVCFKVVMARQHALDYNCCQRWVHRLYGTGIMYTQYRDIVDNLHHGGTFRGCDSHVPLMLNERQL